MLPRSHDSGVEYAPPAGVECAGVEADVPDIAAALERTRAEVGAKTATVSRLAPDGRLEIAWSVGDGYFSLQQGRRFSRDAPTPVAEVFRTGAPIWLASPPEIAGRFPALAGLAHAWGDGAWAALPLGLAPVHGSSRPGRIGSLFLTWRDPRPFPREGREALLATAGRVAAVVEAAPRSVHR